MLDDLARFVADRSELCERIKSVRHEVSAVVARLQIAPEALLGARDTPGDVGTTISAPAEYRRADARELARVNSSRAGESLRSLEETAKALGKPVVAAGFESLRYRVYDIEKHLVAALPHPGARQWRLCVLITESLCRLPWSEVARRALIGGADCLQLREKSLDDVELLARARAFATLVREHGATFIMNDRADVALAAGADGVHLGQADLPVEEVRKILPAGIIGVSTERIEQARAALRAGADYCGIGPMFPTATKDKPRIAGPEYLREYLADPSLAEMPHLAIGGITTTTLPVLISAGARGVAVSSAVCGAIDPEQVCRELRSLFIDDAARRC